MALVDTYPKVQADADKFEGMMNPLSVALFQAFLSHQAEMGLTGDLMEFGVYRGKSASLLLNNLGKDDTLHMVDVKDYPELDKLSEISDQFTFTKGKSEDLFKSEEYLNSIPKQVRFSHHDASHSYINVSAEMEAMASRIAPGGLMVLDDFGNPSYFQVVAACFTYLAREDSPLDMVLYSNNKAYLCLKDDFDMYSKFILEKLLPEINSLDMKDCYVTRTEKHAGYRGFSLFPKNTPDQPDRYGEHIYGDRYYKI